MDTPPSYTKFQSENSQPTQGPYSNDAANYTPYSQTFRSAIVEAYPLEPRALPVLVPVRYHHSSPSRRMILAIVIILLLGVSVGLIGVIIINSHVSASTHGKILRQV